MLTVTYQKYLRKVNDRLEQFTNTRYWALKTVLLCSVLFFVTSFPSGGYQFYRINDDKIVYWKFLEEKIKAPFAVRPEQTSQSGSNLGKRAFRLTMPVIGHLFGLKVAHLFIIQQLVGVLLFLVIAKLAETTTGDRVTALLMTIAFTCTYVGKACFLDITFGWFDGVAYCCLALAMLYRNPLLIGLFTFLACWVDERAVLASGLVFVWWKVQEAGEDAFSLPRLFSFKRYSVTVLLIVLLYGVIRVALGRQYGLATPVGSQHQVGLEWVRVNVANYLAAGLFSSLEFFWLLLIGAVGLLFERGKVLLALVFAGLVALIAGAALSVADVTRSLCYAFPAVFIALHLVGQPQKQAATRQLVLAVAFLNFLVGSYFVLDGIAQIAPKFSAFIDLRNLLSR